MPASPEDQERKKRLRYVVILYPLALILVGIFLNFFAFGVNSFTPTTPSQDVLLPLGVAAILLLANHTWIMTSTELTRSKYGIFATPEEWAASGTQRSSVAHEGTLELERRHNAHRNTTENTIYYILTSLVFVFISPTILAAQIWLIGFSVARLGYTYSYLSGKDNLRGLFMSLSLLAVYGMASYFALSLII